MTIKAPSKEVIDRISAGGIGAILSAIIVAAGFIYNDRLSLETRINRLENLAEQNAVILKDLQRTIRSRMTVEVSKGTMQ